MLPVKIVSTGCYIPSVKVLSTELDRKFGLEPGTVEEKTGVHARYYGNEIETSPYMGAKAVKAALDHAHLTIDDIDALVSVSGSAAQLLPCTASLIVAALGYSGSKRLNLAAFDINSTCLSFLMGFDTMAHLVAAGRYRRVVLVVSENFSPCLSPTELESAALMGDAAVAMILEHTAADEPSQLSAASFALVPEGIEYSTLHGLGTVHGPASPRPTTPEDNFFTMNGPKLFRLASQLMPTFFDRFLTENKQLMSDIDLFVMHQSSGPAVALMSRRLSWPEDRHFVYLREYGNTVAASILLGLHFAIEQGRLQRGHKVLLYGQGAGLALGIVTFVY
jgi:3-oxoacyl-[acyl-carrier-protein] synthase III